MASPLSSLSSRLDSLLPVLLQIRKTTGSASISCGALHKGKMVFSHHDGYRDADQRLPADANTMYLLGSLTKGFVAAACGILVDEGKLNWTTPLSEHVPFNTVHDPMIGERATLWDALSHATGLARLDGSWYGLYGETILKNNDLMHVINHLPPAKDFRAKWHYNNYMYAMIGQLVGRVSGEGTVSSWGSFIQERIFTPLKMERSSTDRNLLPGDNIAEPHVVLDDGTAKRIPQPEMSDKTPIGPAGAVWSTVPDMLVWAGAILDTLACEALGTRSQSPLRQMRMITSHKIPLVDGSLNENTYGFGWARAVMPSIHLGGLSGNGAQRDRVLGKDSPSRLVIYHNGGLTGYLSALYLFPECQSAVVALGNAAGLGDGPDWAAQAIIQALFDLEPKLNFADMASERADAVLRSYDRLMEMYEHHRTKGTKKPPLHDFFGTYRNNDVRMTIDVNPLRAKNERFDLEMHINKRQLQSYAMSHYHFDTFGFPPSSREEQQLKCMTEFSKWDQLLFEFQRNGRGDVVSLKWKMEPELEPFVFARLS